MPRDLDSLRHDLRWNRKYGLILVLVCTIPALAVIALSLAHIRDTESQAFAKLIQIPISLIAKFPFVIDVADCPALVGRVCIDPWYRVFNSALWIILEVAGLCMIASWLRLYGNIRKLENEAIDEANRRQIRRERGFIE